ncbi:hypothetical protein MD484_g885, partial [Candolleomyces efflorescens]
MADSQPLPNRNAQSSGNAAARVRKACLDFNIQDPDKVKVLAETLDSAAQELQIEAARKLAGADHALWLELRRLWKDLARFQLTFWDNEEDEDNEDTTVTLNSESRAVRSLFTSNQNLVAALWETYLSLPEDQVILMKLLAKSAIGVRICISLLDDMLKLFEADEESEGGKAFNVGYAIFTRLIEEGTVPDLYKKFTMPDEIITPHQTTLLKLVDSYLQSIQLDISTTPEVAILQTHVSLGPFLAKRFFTLSNYAQTSMQKALGNGKASPSSSKGIGGSSSPAPNLGPHTTEPPAELDVMLPKVCEALVLVTQCVTTIALEAEEHKGVQFAEGSVASISNMKDFFIDVRYSSQGLIENLIETLRLLDLFLPRIYFGKPVPSSAAAPKVDPTGFLYVKRDLVRLLGALAHESRGVQDRTRNANGIPVVMNLCVIDERNPFLREHALFTLHNLLKNNPENQAIVDAIRPAAELDDAGVLKDKFSALKIK